MRSRPRRQCVVYGLVGRFVGVGGCWRRRCAFDLRVFLRPALFPMEKILVEIGRLGMGGRTRWTHETELMVSFVSARSHSLDTAALCAVHK